MDRRNFFITSSLGLVAAGLAGAASGEERMQAAKSFRLDIGGPLPDPLCVRHEGAWYLTGTHSTRRDPDGAVYDMYRSEDLHTWTPLGPVLEFPVYDGSDNANFWAPELLIHEGKFYLYHTADSNRDP